MIRQCIEEASRQFRPETLQAFRRFVIEARPAEEVARELDTTANAVFLAKHRILKRTRELLPLMEDIW